MKNIRFSNRIGILLFSCCYFLIPYAQAQQLAYNTQPSTLTIIADIDCEIEISSDSFAVQTYVLKEAISKSIELPASSYKIRAFRGEVSHTYEGKTKAGKTKVQAIELYDKFHDYSIVEVANDNINQSQVNEIKYKSLVRKGDDFMEWGDLEQALKAYQEAKNLGIHPIEIEQKIDLAGGDLTVKKGILKDPDGNIYPTIKIGSQTWMAENLRYDIEGSYLPSTLTDSKYGYLYTWNAANKACPAGWHLPKREEWNLLLDFIGTDAGIKLRTTTDWLNTGLAADNSLEFNALPAGWFDLEYAMHNNLNEYSGFWSASQANSHHSKAYYFGIHYKSPNVIKDAEQKNYALSVRCIKD